MSLDFSAGALQGRKEWHNIFKMMKGKNLQPRIPYPARLSFRFNGEIKNFTDKQKLREFSTTKPSLQQMLKKKNFRRQETQEMKKTYKIKPRIIKKMAIRTYILIMTSNVNEVNAPIKTHRLDVWTQK